MYWINEITDSLGLTYSQVEPAYALYLVGTRIDHVDHGLVTGIQFEPTFQVSDFVIFDNYPNPFNAQTKISFRVPWRTTLEASVWNILGQKIRHLYEGKLEPGDHSLLWDGRLDDGQGASSGMYLLRFDVNNQIEVRRSMLLR